MPFFATYLTSQVLLPPFYDPLYHPGRLTAAGAGAREWARAGARGEKTDFVFPPRNVVF